MPKIRDKGNLPIWDIGFKGCACRVIDTLNCAETSSTGVPEGIPYGTVSTRARKK